ncbi:Uncharacterized protein APZ42_013747 [Daphnia magna]|uniref:Uncharacterized protein n=1 Tax=Daphnia magna TaxID=35525 RepID=A0A162QJC5_9CRUS|nr:Uncharacterized protein APZ42_013747 [Daphnia magna]
MTAKDQRYVLLMAKRNRFKTLPVLHEEYNCGRKIKEQVCETVLRNSLAKNALNGRVAAKKPLLRSANIKKRLAFAKAHVDWSEKQWSRVLFTDESKFEFFGNKRRIYVRRFANERFKNYCLKPTVKHGGGSVMVWGGICVRGVTRLKLIVGKMDSSAYKTILQYNVLPDGVRLLGKGFILQQDNDPKHKEKRVMRYLTNKENDGTIKNMIWPPQSPDLNPIEQIWDHLDTSVRRICRLTSRNFFEQLQNCWHSISRKTLKKYVFSMRDRCLAVIAAKGGHTRF